MKNDELAEYMGGAIERLFTGALKTAAVQPKETAFLMKYALSIKKAQKLRLRYEQDKIHIPPFLIASITASCNLHCKGCYARENHICGEQSAGEMLSAQRWGELFQEAAEIGVSFILLAGGEPLLRKEVIEKASKFETIIFPVFTNGTVMDGNDIDLFDRHRNLIPIISIEGNEEKTDARRGAGTYCKINAAMDRLKSIKTMFGASVTVTTENCEEVTSEAFIGQLRESGCKIVFFVEYVPAEPGTEALAPTDKERSCLEKRQKELREKWQDVLFLSFPGDEKFTGGCLAAGRGFFHINPYGNAEPCPFSPYSDTSVRNHSLLETLQSPLFKKLKQNKLVGGQHIGGCSLFAHEKEVKQLCKK